MTSTLSAGVRSATARLLVSDVSGVPWAPSAFSGGSVNWNASPQCRTDGVPLEEAPLAAVKVIVEGSASCFCSRTEPSVTAPATTLSVSEERASLEPLGGCTDSTAGPTGTPTTVKRPAPSVWVVAQPPTHTIT